MQTDVKCQWSTANGRFDTSECVKLLFSLPEFSDKKKIIHDFHVIPSMKLAYDMIIGLDLLNKLGIVLDFDRKILEWNSTEVEMEVRTDISTEEVEVLEEDFNEPHSTRTIRKRAVRILDAKYEKADLKKTAEVEGLDVEKRNLLYKLLLSYESLFDGTLGSFKTKPVSIEVKKERLQLIVYLSLLWRF